MLRFSQVIRQCKTTSNSVLTSSANSLKNRAGVFLKNYDTAQVCEDSYQACNHAIINYVRKLESSTNIEIVSEKMDNPWNYNKLSKLLFLIVNKVDKDMAKSLDHGWLQAFEFHEQGWIQNDFSVEDVQHSLPYVLRFLDVMDNQLKVDHEMALYLKENLLSTSTT